MEVEYSPGIQLLPDLKSKMLRFSAQLAETIGKRFSDSVRAEWHLLTDADGHDRYRLVIRDDVDEASAEFTPTQTGAPLYMASRLPALWGDLLHARSARLREEHDVLFSELLPN